MRKEARSGKRAALAADGLLSNHTVVDLEDLAKTLARIRPPESCMLIIRTPRVEWWQENAPRFHQILQQLCWPAVVIQVGRDREEALYWAPLKPKAGEKP